MNAWIFDVDGVLSNLEARKIIEPSILPSVAKILTQGNLVAFNTGREPLWVKEHVISPLTPYLSDSKLLEHIFIAGEKGGVWEQFGQEETIDAELVLPASLRDKIRKLIANEYSDCMFFVQRKKTMISIEMLPEVSFSYFHTRQEELTPALQKY